MITVPQAVEKIIKRSRYLSEALSKDLINASSLARYIKLEVESLTFKDVTMSSIIMAITRLQKTLPSGYPQITVFQEPPDMIVRSNLTLIYVKNSPGLLQKLSVIEESSKGFQKKALFTYGRVETIILTNIVNLESIKKILKKEETVQIFSNVSAITIHLPEEAVQNPGIFYFFIKSLAWEGVNILDILSTRTELTLVFETKDINSAFALLQSLFVEV
ncbi:MAG: hypothetical protein NUV69_05620 [Candidatus Curtissbacteria bacterium]|nr:hypothetical protein [Candidatus Curtissbacteria bacterium]